MKRTSKEFRIQQRIGWLFTAAFLILIVLQSIYILVSNRLPDIGLLLNEQLTSNYAHTVFIYIGTFFTLGAMFFVTSLYDRQFWRAFQVAVFLFIGATVLVFSPIGDLTGPVFMVTGIIVGYQYGFLRRQIMLKLAVVIALAVLSRVGGVILLKQVGVFDVLYTLLALLIFAFLYLTLFREQIQEQWRREMAMQRQISETEKYSQLGKNVTAILHNMKNVYFALNHGLEMLQNRSEEELRQVKVDRMELIASLRSATESFSEKIENIVSYTGSCRKVDKERISLLWHTARLIDIFCIDKNFKQNVEVRFDIPRDLQIVAPPIKINQVLENLLMNSWEAIKEYRGSGSILFYADSDDDWVRLSIEDNGGGIPGFERSGWNGASVVSSDFFSLGKTSKPNGSGHGVAYVIELMRELNGDVVISSTEERGTRVELFFPATDSADSERDGEYADSDAAAQPDARA